jgi:autotransporter-associated beta strand protein
MANRGGGGGGGGYSFPTADVGGSGGSGVVIVRYDGTQLATGGTVSAGTGSAAGQTIHTFSTVGASNFDLSALNVNTRLGAVQTGVISGTGNLSFTGTGQQQLTLNAANTYSGTTRAISGTLNIGNVDALSGSTLDMATADAGTVALTLSGQTYNVGGLQGTRNLALGNNRISVGANNASTSYSGVLSGTGGLTKVGSGSFNLTGNNSYTGTTNVSAGALLVNGDNSAATGAFTVDSGGLLGGSGTVGGATVFLNGSTHSPGNSPGLQGFTSGLTYNTSSTFQWELAGNTSSGRGTNFDAVNVSGSQLSIQSGVTSALVFNAVGSSVDWADTFWGTNQSWQVFNSLAGISFVAASIFDPITLTNDSIGASLATARVGSFFSWSQVGNDLFLNYTAGGGAAVPEPSTCVVLAMAGLAIARRKLRRGHRAADATATT